MDAKDSFQKYLDAGIAFTNLTRAKAEELVHELVQNGEFQSGDARARVDELLERSRKGREAFAAQVRKEVSQQLESVGITSLEDLAEQVAHLIGRTAEAGKAATTKATAKKAPAKKASPTKTTAKKATAKKAAAKKSPATKAAATKAAATKAAAKKSPAKKATGKKAPAKKTPAKKASPTQAGAATIPAPESSD
jgi:polyhydroxyalkanoate synthesis regulator phasin